MCADVERRNQVDRLLRGQVVGAGKREMGVAVKTDRRRQTEQGLGKDSNLFSWWFVSWFANRSYICYLRLKHCA